MGSMDGISSKAYLAALKERGSKKRVTQEFQLIGLEIATTLHDLKNKALYIKYAKELGSDKVLALAKDVAQRRDVKNPAAYFMRVVQNLKEEKIVTRHGTSSR